MSYRNQVVLICDGYKSFPNAEARDHRDTLFTGFENVTDMRAALEGTGWEGEKFDTEWRDYCPSHVAVARQIGIATSASAVPPEQADAREPHDYYCPGSDSGWAECLVGKNHPNGQCKLAHVAPIHGSTSSRAGGSDV